MKKKYSLALSLLLLTAALLLPYYIPVASAQPPAPMVDPTLYHFDLVEPWSVIVEPEVGQIWHGLYPHEIQCTNYSLTHWINKTGGSEISVGDKIALTSKVEPFEKTWYDLEYITVTLNLTLVESYWTPFQPPDVMYVEFEGTKEEFLAYWQYYPNGSQWHEVKPEFSNQYMIVDTPVWVEPLNTSDYIVLNLKDPDTGELKENYAALFHVEWAHTDIICKPQLGIPGDMPVSQCLTRLVYEYPTVIDPTVSTQWWALWPPEIQHRDYHLYCWIDNNNSTRIDVCDEIKIEDKETHEKVWYHVEWVTVTMNVTLKPDLLEWIVLEFGGTLDEFLALGDPRCTWWHAVKPPENFSTWLHILSWNDTDVSDGLTVDDQIDFQDVAGEWHVDWIATELILKPINPPTYFSVDPYYPNVEGPGVCDNFTIDIRITDAPETYAWSLKLSWVQGVLNVTDITEGTWLSAKGTTYLFNTSLVTANEQGSIGIDCTLLGTVPCGACGDGLLCTVTFHVESCAHSYLNLTNTRLFDMSLVRTDYPNTDGFFECGDLHDVAITNITIDPLQIEQDSLAPISIRVYLHNEGDHQETFDLYVYADLEVYDPDDPDVLMVGDEEVDPGSPHSITLNADEVYSGGYPVSWYPTDLPGEQWTISAEVVLTGDEDPHDNIFINRTTVHVVSDDDVKITNVEVSPRKVSKSAPIVSIDVTVLNEGKNPENINVTVRYDGTVIGEKTINLASCYSTVVGFKWNTTNVDPVKIGGDIWAPPTTGSMTYAISTSAEILPPGTEENKNLDDNVADCGLVRVVIYDIAVISVKVLDSTTCYQEGFHPTTYVKATLANMGTETSRVAVYLSITDIGTGQKMIAGLIPYVVLDPGEVQSFDRFAVYGGWNTKVPNMAPPPLFSPVPGHTYAVAVAINPVTTLGYVDDYYGKALWPAPYTKYGNDMNLAYWTLPAVDHDVSCCGIELYANKRPGLQVYYGQYVCINVSVCNQGQVYPEEVNVSLFYRDPAINMTFINATDPITVIGPCEEYEVIDGVIPENDTWWHIMLPDSLESIEFHIDWSNATHFHIDELKPVNASKSIPAPGVENATAELEVLIGSKITDPIPPMQRMNFTSGILMYFVNMTGTTPITWVKPDTTYIVGAYEELGVVGDHPENDTWWHMISPDVPALGDNNPYCNQFHIEKVWYQDPPGVWMFYVDEVEQYEVPKELNLTSVGGVAGIVAQQKMDEIKSCNSYMFAGGCDYTTVPLNGSWWTLQWPLTLYDDVYPRKIQVDQSMAYYSPIINDTMWKFHVNKVMVGTVPRDLTIDEPGYPVVMAWEEHCTTVSFALDTDYPWPGRTTDKSPKPGVQAGFAPCNSYNFIFVAHCQIGATDDDPCDNKCTKYGSFTVRVYCDITGDGVVDGADIIEFGPAVLTKPGQPGYNPFADFTLDCAIDGSDIIELGPHVLDRCTSYKEGPDPPAGYCPDC